MTLLEFLTNLMNFYCILQLTWKTTQAFKKQNSEFLDTLLIKWVLLYSAIQLEWVIILFLQWIPFGFCFPFIYKKYIILPHSKWHKVTYRIIENLEMDEYQNIILIQFSRLVRYILIPSLSIVENWIDLVKVEELDELELKVIRIKEKILNKIQSVEMNKQKQRSRLSNNEIRQELLPVVAQVQDNHKFKDYILVFNSLNNQMQFIDFISREIIYERKLTFIDISEDFSLKATYEDGDQNLELIKLHISDDVDKWLKPVIEILISQRQQQEEEQF